jgi:CRISPR-associated protein Csm1
VLFPATTEAEVAAAADPVVLLHDTLQQVTQQQPAPQVQLERLLYALQRHAWCLSSPLPAVSLYDFARTHAAIAAARAMHDDTVFLLGGDLSFWG